MKFMLFIYPDLSVELSPEQRAQIPAAVGAWIAEMDRRGVRLQGHVLKPAGEAGMSHLMLSGVAADRPEALAVGKAGTVYLCHPFLIHAAQPHRGSTPRFMAQPPLHPAEPVRLEREDGDYSPVEMAIRRALQEKLG